MTKALPIMIISVLTCGIIASGCAKKDTAKAATANHRDAIVQAEPMTDKAQQYTFLMNEAEGFMAAGKYEDAALLGEYMVENGHDNPAIRRIMKKAYEKTVGNLVGK